MKKTINYLNNLWLGMMNNELTMDQAILVFIGAMTISCCIMLAFDQYLQ